MNTQETTLSADLIMDKVVEKFECGLSFARKTTGYKGSYQEYVNLQYSGYVQTCKRCEIKPLSKSKWLESQAK